MQGLRVPLPVVGPGKEEVRAMGSGGSHKACRPDEAEPGGCGHPQRSSLNCSVPFLAVGTAGGRGRGGAVSGPQLSSPCSGKIPLPQYHIVEN